MSREYVEFRLRQIEAEEAYKRAVERSIKVDGKTILWSLSDGCWMLIEGGMCIPLKDLPGGNHG